MNPIYALIANSNRHTAKLG